MIRDRQWVGGWVHTLGGPGTACGAAPGTSRAVRKRPAAQQYNNNTITTALHSSSSAQQAATHTPQHSTPTSRPVPPAPPGHLPLQVALQGSHTQAELTQEEGHVHAGSSAEASSGRGAAAAARRAADADATAASQRRHSHVPRQLRKRAAGALQLVEAGAAAVQAGPYQWQGELWELPAAAAAGAAGGWRWRQRCDELVERCLGQPPQCWQAAQVAEGGAVVVGAQGYGQRVEHLRRWGEGEGVRQCAGQGASVNAAPAAECQAAQVR